MAVLFTQHYFQALDDDGNPLSYGKLYTYAAGTSTPKDTYTTAAGNISHPNPIILDAAGRAIIFLTGAYKFVLHDKDDVPIDNGTTDNVTAFSASTETNEGYFQSFSGDSEETSFTLSENLGNDEKALFVSAQLECVKNGFFATDTDWVKGTGWTIGSGVATATGAISTTIEQSSTLTLVEGKPYSVAYTITRSAGSVTLSLGGTAGIARSASGTYHETIIAGSTQTISFGTSGFTGTLDDVSIREVSGIDLIDPSFYTVSGTALTFTIPPASGNNNIKVRAPFSLIGAAGAAQVAADDAIAAKAAAETAQGLAEDAQTAAELAETNAETAETNAAASEAAAALSAASLSGTSATSVAIATGLKAFTTQAGKLFDVGVFVLIASDADETDYMHGQVTAYSGTDLTVNVTSVGGSGTLDDWKITVSGARGAQGVAGTVSGASSATPTALDKGLFLDVDNSDALSEATNDAITRAALAGATADIAVNSRKITSLADPTNAQDAATKAYVDAEIAGISTDVIKTVKKQVFTSSGTYTPSAGMIFCEVQAKGGGAAGGGAVSSGGTTANNNNGGGGGEGAFVKSVLTATDIGVSKAVSIGTASSTSLGSLVVAVAGSAGSAGTSGRNGEGGLGGNAASCTGDLKIGGADGNNGCGAGTSAGGSGGTGGGSGAGRGGNAASNAADNGDAAQANSGSGGGGAVSNAASTASGGAGSAGYMIIIEYCTE